MTQTIPEVAEESRLRESLEALETALLTPIVPGENVPWRREVESAWPSMETGIDAAVAAHRAQYDQIREIDQEMFKRVEQLKQEDHEIISDKLKFAEAIGVISSKLPAKENNPLRTEDSQEKLVECGIALVLRVRKQQTAVKTWFHEAFNRDRGPVD